MAKLFLASDLAASIPAGPNAFVGSKTCDKGRLAGAAANLGAPRRYHPQHRLAAYQAAIGWHPIPSHSWFWFSSTTLHFWDNSGRFEYPLTLFLTPLAPHRARDRESLFLGSEKCDLFSYDSHVWRSCDCNLRVENVLRKAVDVGFSIFWNFFPIEQTF